MDVTLSKRGDYVMRSAIALARSHPEGGALKIREVVEETEVPQSFASQILADLVRAGLASSKAGRSGGYRLTRAPEEITVLEVVEAAEGRLRVDRCALGEGPCRWEAVCPLHETWSELTGVLRDLLARTSLAEIASRDAAIEAGSYEVPMSSHRSHPTSTELSDTAQVELPAPRAHAALARVSRALDDLVAAAALEAVAVLDDAKGPRRIEAEASLVPVREGTGDRSGDSDYLLAWLLLAGPLRGRLEGDLSVSELDADRSELSVRVTWRLDGDSGPSRSAAELDEQARKMVRSFLRRLARDLEASELPEAPRQPGRRTRAHATRSRPGNGRRSG